MNIFFGKVPSQYAEEDPESYFEHKGNKFYYKLEVNPDEEEFSLEDTSGRRIPFELDTVYSLVNSLCYVRDYTKAKKLADEYVDRSLNTLARAYSLLE